VRRTLIQSILPFAFCLVPVLGGVLVAVSIPIDARNDYLSRIRNSPMDWLILSLGAVLFAFQIALTWRALRQRGDGFDERPDRWLSNLAQAAEWFPLLGLLGTVAGILQTFGTLRTAAVVTPQEVISRYAPAITATGSGLLMALLNILPTWVVQVGRDLIRSLAGVEQPKEGKVAP
jgi:hypothetical protein